MVLKPYFFPMIAAHGILMFLAWGVLAPIGIYIARYEKERLGPRWFHYHRAIMAAVALLAITGYSLGYISCVTHFNKPHKLIGLSVAVAVAIQAIWGQAIHMKRDPMRTTRPWYNQAHRIFGPLVFIAALVNMSFGLYDHPKMSRAFPILFAIYWVVVASIFAWAEYRLWLLHGIRRHSFGGPSERVDDS